MTQQTELIRKRQALFARTSTPALVGSAMMLDALDSPTAEERLTIAWICQELERRHPEVVAALEAWCENLSSPLSRVEVTIAALPAEAVAA